MPPRGGYFRRGITSSSTGSWLLIEPEQGAATDRASFASDGGLLIYGVDESTTRRAPRRSCLVQLPERLEQIALTAVTEPLFVRTLVLPTTADPTRGFVAVVVPPSEHAPPTVDGRYYGRGDKTKIALSDAQVSAIHAQRRTGTTWPALKFMPRPMQAVCSAVEVQPCRQQVSQFQSALRLSLSQSTFGVYPTLNQRPMVRMATACAPPNLKAVAADCGLAPLTHESSTTRTFGGTAALATKRCGATSRGSRSVRFTASSVALAFLGADHHLGQHRD